MKQQDPELKAMRTIVRALDSTGDLDPGARARVALWVRARLDDLIKGGENGGSGSAGSTGTTD